MVDSSDSDGTPESVSERLPDDELASKPTDITGRSLSMLKKGARDGSLALVLGGLLLWRGLRSIRHGRARGVIPAGIGAVAVRAGLRKRRSASSDLETEMTLDIETDDFVPSTPGDDEDESVSDEAYAATHRPEGIRTSEVADDEERPSSDSEGSEESVEPSADFESSEQTVDDLDPRVDDDDEADLSETARADEPGEATGPAPEQAQPARSIDAEADPISGEPDPDATDEDDRNGSDEGGESLRQDETDPDASQADEDPSATDADEEDEQ